MAPPLMLMGPNASNATPGMILSQTAGNSNSQVDGTSTAHSVIENEARTRARSSARTRSGSRTRGTSETEGWTESYEAVFTDLPGSFHSKENELYFAGERIRQLPTGRCFVAYRGTTTSVSIPAPKRKS
jgi:hypothetical protein